MPCGEGGVILEETTPIREEMFHPRLKEIFLELSELFSDLMLPS